MKKIVWAMAAAMAVVVVSANAQPRKVDVCHRNGDQNQKINISLNGLPAHIGHGDAVPGNAVPGQPGYEFDSDCLVVLAQPNFVAFNIRNHSLPPPLPTSISAPWDTDMYIVENAEGDGFSALTPRGGQKVGYGTNFFDNDPVNSIQKVQWYKVSGKPGLVAYLNIWVTDGTNFAVIASENDYRDTDFSTRQEWKVFEYSSTAGLNWLCPAGQTGGVSSQYLTCNGVKMTLAGIPGNIKILSPNMSAPPTYVGTGAPRGGYGFNLIWGDTQSNFTTGIPFTMNSLCIKAKTDGMVYCAED